MTPDQALAPIKARLEAATPGPWDFEEYDGTHGVYALEMQDNGDYPAIIGYPNESSTAADAEFIANAPTDMGRLLAAVQAVDLDSLMAALVEREARWEKAYEIGDLTHDEASQIALEDRWVYAQLADMKHALSEALGVEV